MNEIITPQSAFPRLSTPIEDCALLLDVDGTILDIALTPREVFVSSELREVLAQLQRRMNNGIAFVSGRDIDELDLIFAPLTLAAVGGHGAEIRLEPEGEISSEAIAPLSKKTKQRFAAIAEAAPGIIVEDKDYSIALHYRLAPDWEDHVRRCSHEIAGEIGHGMLEVLEGKSVVEIKQAGFSKATGFRKLMSVPPFAGRRPIFIGDDKTDEVVFPVISEYGGLGFSVGRKIANTNGCFERPTDVRRWLKFLAEGR